jgi:branched-subunit amino acid ABC-type transport system permease component
VLATWITPQLVFNGAVSGLAIGLLAMGMVLVYRSTRVVNFAVGSIGLVGAALLPVLVITFGFPYGVALPAALVCGTGFATIVELIVIRRLFHSPRVIVLVATVGIAQLAAGTAAAYPEIRPGGQPYPKAVSATWDDLLGLRVTGSQLSVVVIVPLLAVGLMWLLHRTTFGKAVEASADNRPLARLAGVNPKLVSTFVWTVAGLLSTVSMVLL